MYEQRLPLVCHAVVRHFGERPRTFAITQQPQGHFSRDCELKRSSATSQLLWATWPVVVLSPQQWRCFTQEEAAKQNLEFSANLWMRRCLLVLFACWPEWMWFNCCWSSVFALSSGSEKDKLPSHKPAVELYVLMQSTHLCCIQVSVFSFLACADNIVPFFTTPHATACIHPFLCSSSSLWSRWIPVPAVSGAEVPAVLLCGRSSTRFNSVWPQRHQKGEQLAKFKEVGGPLYEVVNDSLS